MSWDIAGVVSKVGDATGITSAFETSQGGYDVPVDAGTDIFSAFDASFAGGVHAHEIKKGSALPNMTYQLGSSRAVRAMDYRVGQLESYLVTIRASSTDDLIAKQNVVIGTTSQGSIALEVTDRREGVEHDEDNERTYIAEMEVDATYPVDSSGGPAGTLVSELPIALVFAAAQRAEEPDDMRSMRQQMFYQYGIVIATVANNIATLSEAILSELHGYETGDAYSAMEYVSGEPLESIGPMRLWLDVYQHWTHKQANTL